MNSNTTLELLITAKDEATRKLEGFQDTLKGMEGSLKTVRNVSTAVFATISAVAIKTVSDYSEAEKATAITNQSLANSFNNLSNESLKNVQSQLKVTSGGLKELSDMANKAGASAVQLGFDDEDASRSFAKLFAVTKDTAQSQKEMALAMDLARFKGISLEEATQKLVMVHSGATKELKTLGIAVTDGATVMQNLDSITKQVTGSSEAYLKTTAGATDALKVQMGNLSETIGQQLAPILVSVLTALTPVLLAVTKWIEDNPVLVKWILIITGVLSGLIAVLASVALAISAVTLVASPWLLIIGAIIIAIGALIFAGVELYKNWDNIKEMFRGIMASIADYFKNSVDSILGYFNNLMSMVNAVMDRARQVASFVSSVASSAVSAVTSTYQTVSSTISGKRATGGNVAGGSSYLVGERGAEIFTPTASGMITPNNQLGGSGNNIIVNITGTFLSEDAGRKVGDMIINRFKNMSRIGL